jgi:hypothetical protein
MRRYSRRDVREILGGTGLRLWYRRRRRRRLEFGIQIGTFDARCRFFFWRYGCEKELVSEHIRFRLETAYAVGTDSRRAEIAAFRINRRFFSIGVHGTHQNKLDEWRRWRRG